MLASSAATYSGDLSASRARSLTRLGIVAEKSSVCRSKGRCSMIASSVPAKPMSLRSQCRSMVVDEQDAIGLIEHEHLEVVGLEAVRLIHVLQQSAGRRDAAASALTVERGRTGCSSCSADRAPAAGSCRR